LEGTALEPDLVNHTDVVELLLGSSSKEVTQLFFAVKLFFAIY